MAWKIPVVPMEHQYLITRPIEGLRADFPTLRDPDNLVYVHEEVGGLVVGGYERNPDPWHVDDPIRATSTTGSSRRSGNGSSRSPTARP